MHWNESCAQTQEGQCIRFPLEKLRVFSSRNSSGVRAVKLSDKDKVVNVSLLQHEKIEDLEVRENYLKYASAKRKDEMVELPDISNKAIFDDLSNKEEFVLTVTSKGYGKRTSAYEYRITNRGGKGFMGGKLTDKNGDIIASFVVQDDDEIIIVSNKGQVIRQKVKDIRIVGRNSIGVILFKLEDKEEVVSVTKIKLLPEELNDDQDIDTQNELV